MTSLPVSYARVGLGVLAAGLLLLSFFAVYDTILGDAYIHAVFARGIWQGEWFAYNGIFSAGSTSPLWSLLLAPAWGLLGDGVVHAARALSAGASLICLLLVYCLARRLSLPPAVGALAALLLGGSYVFGYWSAKAMEAPLVAALTLACLIVWTDCWRTRRSTTTSTDREALLGMLLGITILARPEGWALSALLGGSLLLGGRPQALLTVGLPALIVAGPYLWLIFEYTGSVLPSSMARILHAQQFAVQTGSVIWTPEIVKILLTKFLPVIVFLPLGLRLLPRAAAVVCGLWVLYFVAFFTFVLPLSQGYRYILPAVPVLLLVAAAGMYRVACSGTGGRWWRVTRVSVVAVAVLAYIGISGQQMLEQRQRVLTCEVPYLDAQRRTTGALLAELTSPGQSVAMKEVDQSAYFSTRRMISMDGILDTRAVPFVREGDQLGYLESRQPDWFVLEEDMYRRYPHWQGSTVLPLLDRPQEVGTIRSLGSGQFELVAIVPGAPAGACGLDRAYSWYMYRTTWQ